VTEQGWTGYFCSYDPGWSHWLLENSMF